jgi:hypothetical protein
MPSVNKDCTDAIVEYARHAFEAVSDGSMNVRVSEDERWRRGSDGVARLQTVKRPFLILPPSDESKSYEATCAAVRADPDFGPLVGGMVGSTQSLSRFDERFVIYGAVQTFVTAGQGSNVDEEAVRREIGSLREYVTATERHSALLVPLPGLESSLLPFELEDGLQIDALTDDEIDACARTAVLQPTFPHMNMLTAKDCVGVRIRLTSPAVVTAPGAEPDLFALNDSSLTSPHRFGDRSPWRSSELVEDVLFVLRLARSDFIGTRGAVHVNDGPMGTSYESGTRATRQLVQTSYVIDDETGRKIRELWSSLRRSTSGRSLPSICSRRFNSAMDRVSSEDAIVDHLIAAEALFLQDARTPEGRGELGFRLAMRAGTMLEATGRHRRPTFMFMKRAYDLRSTVAHGGSAPPEVKVRERGNVPLHQFVSELGQLMRDALLQAVREYASRSNFATSEFWDELLLGAPHPGSAPS